MGTKGCIFFHIRLIKFISAVHTACAEVWKRMGCNVYYKVVENISKYESQSSPCCFINYLAISRSKSGTEQVGCSLIARLLSKRVNLGVEMKVGGGGGGHAEVGAQTTPASISPQDREREFHLIIYATRLQQR